MTKKPSILECLKISSLSALIGGLLCFSLIQLVWAFPGTLFAIANWSFKSWLTHFVTEGGLWEFTKIGLGVFFTMTPLLWVIFFCEIFSKRVATTDK